MATAPLENSMVEKFLPEQQSADEWKRQSSKVPIGRWMFGFWMVHPSKTQNGWEGVENLLARFFGVWRARRGGTKSPLMKHIYFSKRLSV